MLVKELRQHLSAPQAQNKPVVIYDAVAKQYYRVFGFEVVQNYDGKNSVETILVKVMGEQTEREDCARRLERVAEKTEGANFAKNIFQGAAEMLRKLERLGA